MPAEFWVVAVPLVGIVLMHSTELCMTNKNGPPEVFLHPEHVVQQEARYGITKAMDHLVRAFIAECALIRIHLSGATTYSEQITDPAR